MQDSAQNHGQKGVTWRRLYLERDAKDVAEARRKSTGDPVMLELYMTEIDVKRMQASRCGSSLLAALGASTHEVTPDAGPRAQLLLRGPQQ